MQHQFSLVIAERARVSREIHDTLLQSLVGVALQFDGIANALGPSSVNAREQLTRVRRQVEAYIREARQSIWDLRSPKHASYDLPRALREAGERVIAGRPVDLDVRVSGAARTSASLVDEQLLAIGQEALSNAVRHGRARAVSVQIDYSHDQTRLRVQDDGCGFDPDEARRLQGHYGLISMHERAEQVRGRIVISSVPGEGTAVEAIVPV